MDETKKNTGLEGAGIACLVIGIGLIQAGEYFPGAAVAAIGLGVLVF